MRQVMLQLFGVVVCLALSAGVSVACTCMHMRGDPDAAFKTASTVFSGKVLKITEGKSSMPASGVRELVVKFRVEKSWKLIRKDEVIVVTLNTSNLCGFPFEIGERYLVYAVGGGSKFMTDICSRTTQAPGAKEDLDYLSRKRLIKGK